MEQRVSLITLAVTDVTKSAKFYKSLGWKQTASPDGITVFDLIGQTLGLYSKAAMADEMGLEAQNIGGFSGITLAHNTRSKEEVEQILTLAGAAGGRIVKPAQDVFWGGFHGYFADPDNHHWEVAFNPFSPVNERGEFQWNGA